MNRAHTERSLNDEGSFVLFTTAGYVLLFIIAGVVSIFAYDARLENQSTELALVTLIPPPERVIPDVRDHHPAGRPNPGTATSTRPIVIDRTDNPTNPPDQVGVIAPTIPPASSLSVVGPEVLDPLGSGADRVSNSTTGGNPQPIRIITPPPPPPPPAKKIVAALRVLNSQALSLPKPPYPPMAKLMKIQGTVSVQVLIDETGKVISAKATTGSPFLVREAEKAAYQARFSPTIIGDQPVKVSGIITYNFLLQ